MNKKGFMFVETIVTLTVLMALLITIYTIFVNLLQKEKTTAEYDSYGDKYALFYYKEQLKESAMYNRYNNGRGKKFYHFHYGMDLSYQSDATKRYCNAAIISCDYSGTLNDLDTLPKSNTDSNPICTGVSDDFEKYKNQLEPCPNGAVMIFLAEFYNRDTYSYAHIYYPNIPTGEGG